MGKKYTQVIKLLLLLFTLSAFFIPPLIGPADVTISEAITDFQSLSGQILFQIRLPRIVFAFLAGASLALIGSVFQALLRNDLATPYTLGVSSGGAFGAVLAIKLGLDWSLLGFSSISLFSVLGSLMTISIIYMIARTQKGLSTYTLILAGVTISLFFSSLILFVHYLADFTETYRMVQWIMGFLGVNHWSYPLIVFVFFLPVALFFIHRVPAFNLLIAGEDISYSKGVDVGRLQRWTFSLASILVGVIVSIAGPIGFLGLIVPHLLRLLIGADHRALFPAVIVFGGAFLVWCDTFARTVIAPAEIPVGIITSLLGGPFFIYLLIRHKRRF
ncbi:MAG: iron chelate uptake ABC transporter family permease subunit [Caldithrix sp.]|nr:iron chelate uptake ABC transporter family permease subunit [Caldithrix sp.]